MKTLLALLLLWPAHRAAAAEDWTVKVTARNGRHAYSHSQRLTVGRQASFSGAPAMRGGGPERGLVFHGYLSPLGGGLYRLDYLAELSGDKSVRPPFQAGGKAPLSPGRPVLAAAAGGWKLELELQGGEKGPRAGSGSLEASLKCRGASYPVRFAYLPDEQYTAALYSEDGDAVTRFMVGLLPNAPGAGGEFRLQYTLQLRSAGATLTENQGELVLAPGGGRRSAAAGEGCVFTARALR